MAEIINLKLVRKVREREAKERAAETNRAKHGRSKVEKLQDALEERRQRDRLDALKRDVPGSEEGGAA
jgi:hypothetical protein